MAGNPLLISPELLAKEKLLDANELRHYHLPQEPKADYTKAEEIKNALFNKAYESFKTGNFASLQNVFEQFCEKEKYWLDDFALYAVLKKQNGGKPWYEWENDLKQRSTETLQKFSTGNADEIIKTKWLQFIFFRQWKDLKAYCNNMNIQLIGDMPFYVSYDSADAWANKEIFALDEDGKRTGMAGVPPDAFSADGQLWGMPVFKWDVLKERNYDWWIERLRKNIELYDIVRLDHFGHSMNIGRFRQEKQQQKMVNGNHAPEKISLRPCKKNLVSCLSLLKILERSLKAFTSCGMLSVCQA
jgi:4-alpha-glucanotransferase